MSPQQPSALPEPSDPRARRRRCTQAAVPPPAAGRVGIVAALAVALAGGIAPGVQAVPAPDDTRSTSQDEQGAARRVAEIEADLATLAGRQDDAWIRAGLAAEDAAEAQVALDAASAEVEAAQLALTDAEAGEAGARSAMGATYRASRRSGGSLETLRVVLDAGALDQIVASEQAQRLTGRKVQAVADGHRTARALADSARARSVAAQDARIVARDRAEQTYATALGAQQDIDGAVRAAAARREELLADLAAARATPLEVERDRQDALDADRRRAAEEQAQAQRGGQDVSVVGGGGPPAPAPPPSGVGGSTSPAAPPVPPPEAPPVVPPVAPPVAPPVTPPVTPPVASPGSGAAKGQAAVDWARSKIGADYLLGGTGPAYDCSGLTSRAWASVGVDITRTSRSQYARVAKIGYDQLRPGDLIFYGRDPHDAGSIWHVAIYAGGGQMIEASQPGVPLRLTAVRWTSTMPYAGRP